MDKRKRRNLGITAVAVVTGLCAALAVASLGTAAPAAPPTVQDPPAISGKAEVGQTLSATTGRWTNNPTNYTYEWRRCDSNGGSCATIGGQTAKDYELKTVDKDNTLRVRVTARNADGAGVSTSVPTGVVAAAPATTTTTTTTPGGGSGGGCGSASSVNVSALSPPERLLVDRQEIQPTTVGSSTQDLTVRFRVSACSGKPVQGALVYVTAVPYNQFTVPNEAQTGADGFATLQMSRLRGFPATPSQQLLVVFVRARKPGEPILSGISTRRLVSFRVDLRG